MEREYDIIVWGASEFPQTLVVNYMAEQQNKAVTSNGQIAGRAKAAKVLAGREIYALPQIAVTKKVSSALVQQAQVVLTTVGPYARAMAQKNLVANCAKHVRIAGV